MGRARVVSARSSPVEGVGRDVLELVARVLAVVHRARPELRSGLGQPEPGDPLPGRPRHGGTSEQFDRQPVDVLVVLVVGDDRFGVL